MDHLQKSAASGITNIYCLEGTVPLGQALCFGVQHVIATFLGNLTPILMVLAVAKYGGAPLSQAGIVNLVQATMVAAGLATLIQVFPIWRVGTSLPLFMGTGLVFVGACMTIAARDYSILIGAIIASGCIEGIIGLFAPKWRYLISPVIAGNVILAAGISLFGSCMTLYAGGNAPDAGNWPHITTATITLIAGLLAKLLFNGIYRHLSVIIGIVIGYIFACIITLTGLNPLIDFSIIGKSLSAQGLINFPTLFPYVPTFEADSIVLLTIICLSSAMATIGTTQATCNVALHRSATAQEIGGAVCCNGFASSLFSGLLGCLPMAAYESNLGILCMSKAINLKVIATGAGILILSGCIPVLSSLLTTIPACVLGGGTVLLVGSIATIGLRMIGETGFNSRNSIIIAVPLCLGLGVANTPQLANYVSPAVKEMLLATPITIVFLSSMLLSLCLPNQSTSSQPAKGEKL